MCEDSYTLVMLFVRLFVCVSLCLLIHMYLYTVQSVVLLTLFALITQWTSATTCLPFKETVNTCWENTEGLITHPCFLPHSYKTLSEMKTISIFLYMLQHISEKKVNVKCHSKYHIETLSSHQLIFSLCLLWNFLKAISHSACFSGKKKVCNMIFIHVYWKAWAQSSYSIETILFYHMS